MKLFIFSFLALIIWFVVWAYVSFNFIIDGWLDSINDVISDSIQIVYTGDVQLLWTWLVLSWWNLVAWQWTTKKAVEWYDSIQDTLDNKQKELLLRLENEKQTIKENIKQQVIDYVNGKIDSLF